MSEVMILPGARRVITGPVAMNHFADDRGAVLRATPAATVIGDFLKNPADALGRIDIQDSQRG